jgi:hypothetical protein
MAQVEGSGTAPIIDREVIEQALLCRSKPSGVKTQRHVTNVGTTNLGSKLCPRLPRVGLPNPPKPLL